MSATKDIDIDTEYVGETELKRQSLIEDIKIKRAQRALLEAQRKQHEAEATRLQNLGKCS